MKTSKYILPAFWAPALINGDLSGLTDHEEQCINNWESTIKPGSCVGCSDESWFANSNDADNIGGDVMEFTFIDHSKEG